MIFLGFCVNREVVSFYPGYISKIFAIENQTIALCIDARLSGEW